MQCGFQTTIENLLTYLNFGILGVIESLSQTKGR